MNKIDTVIFDIGNVLVDFCWKDALLGMNLDEVIMDRLAKATVLDELWDEFDKGVLSEEEILEGFIKNDPEIESVIRDFFYVHYFNIVKKRDYANEWIDSLKKRGYKVYFLSNFSKKGFRDLAKHLDFVEKGDGAVISYIENLIKPDPAIYEVLLSRYSINPECAVFIDDTLKNVEAAKQFSLNVIQFIDKQQVLADLEALGVIFDDSRDCCNL